MVLLSSAAMFLAGIGVGLAVPKAASLVSEPPIENPHQRFVRDFVAAWSKSYDLTRDQQRKLRAILWREYHARMKIYNDAGHQQLPDDVRTALDMARQRMVRQAEWILTDEQKQKYRRDQQAPSGLAGSDGIDGK